MTHDEQKPVREAFEKWYTEKYLGVNIDYVWLGYQAATTREAELLAVIRAMDVGIKRAKSDLQFYLRNETVPLTMEQAEWSTGWMDELSRLAEQVV